MQLVSVVSNLIDKHGSIAVHNLRFIALMVDKVESAFGIQYLCALTSMCRGDGREAEAGAVVTLTS